MARQRPFLWRNHREAIDKGYLKKGTSSAISFPTGGVSRRWPSLRSQRRCFAMKGRLPRTDARTRWPDNADLEKYLSEF
jgi:hypothetical protein